MGSVSSGPRWIFLVHQKKHREKNKGKCLTIGCQKPSSAAQFDLQLILDWRYTTSIQFLDVLSYRIDFWTVQIKITWPTWLSVTWFRSMHCTINSIGKKGTKCMVKPCALCSIWSKQHMADPDPAQFDFTGTDSNLTIMKGKSIRSQHLHFHVFQIHRLVVVRDTVSLKSNAFYFLECKRRIKLCLVFNLQMPSLYYLSHIHIRHCFFTI